MPLPNTPAKEAKDGSSETKEQQERISTEVKSSEEKARAPHSSTLAWKIPWMEEPGGLQSMGPLGVGHD